MNVPAFAAAEQNARAPLVAVLSVAAPTIIRTAAFEEPPVQVRVIPLERVTGGMMRFAGLVKFGGG